MGFLTKPLLAWFGGCAVVTVKACSAATRGEELAIASRKNSAEAELPTTLVLFKTLEEE